MQGWTYKTVAGLRDFQVARVSRCELSCLWRPKASFHVNKTIVMILLAEYQVTWIGTIKFWIGCQKLEEWHRYKLKRLYGWINALPISISVESR